MALEEFNELEEIAGDANILNETRFMLEEGRGELSEEDMLTINLAIDFLDRVTNGILFEDNKRYAVHNLKDSLNTLKNSESILKNFKNRLEFIQDSKTTLINILIEKKINKNSIDQQIISFFRELGDSLLQQALDYKSRIL